MEEQTAIEVGSRVEDFVLKDHRGGDFRLSAWKGTNVLLSFHPLAWTDICAAQMKALERNRERFEKLHTVAVGISVDSVPCKKAWADILGIRETRLLSDFWPHGGVAARLGLFRVAEGISERAALLVDEESRLLFRKVYPLGEVPDLEEIVKAITT